MTLSDDPWNDPKLLEAFQNQIAKSVDYWINGMGSLRGEFILAYAILKLRQSVEAQTKTLELGMDQ